MSSNTNALVSEGYFFEGAEKLLEIWFEGDVFGSLRKIPREKIDAMLDVARCRVLHAISNEKMDSYVLSESSLFISDHRIIIKTCGATQLLAALPVIIELATKYVSAAYYSHKNFSKPELQPPLQRCFDHEVQYLDEFFIDGSAYCMGSLKQDRWYLYHMNAAQASKTPDHTLEILMTDMPDDVLEIFTQKRCENGSDCTFKAGIDRICPAGTVIHEELFSPCGYSMNGLIPNSVFKAYYPKKVLMTLFGNDFSLKARASQQALWENELPGYGRTNVQFLKLENDETLVYAHFVRKPPRDQSSDEDDGNRSD